MRINRLGLLCTAAVFAAATSLSAITGGTVSAAGQTCTWTGSGSDNNFSTVANWTGCGGAAPTNADAIVLPSSAVTIANNTPEAVNNDLSSVTFASITQTGTGISTSWTSENLYKITGNAISVTGGITSTATKQNGAYLVLTVATDINVLSNQTFSHVNTVSYVDNASATVSPIVAVGTNTLTLQNAYLHSRFSGSGQIHAEQSNTLWTYFGTDTSFTGTVTVASGRTILTERRLLETAGRMAVNDGATLSLSASLIGDRTFSLPLTLAGTGTDGYGALSISGGAGVPYYLTFTGDVTVTKNATIGASNATGTFTGNKIGAYSVTPAPDSVKTVTVPASWRISTANTTVTITDLQPSQSLSVTTGEVVVLNGSRGDVTVSDGGVLKGTGTVAGDAVISGTVAPGLSPGCLSVTGDFTLNGNYEFELGGDTACTTYDQIGVTGTVTLGDTTATLTTLRFNNYTPTQGQVFTIIDNKGAAAVSGTFKNLAEGATFEQNGIVFKISYVGGTGNDVTLTVQNTPSVPNTGFALLKANPLITLAIAIVGALSLIGIARRVKA